jgi:hypothetical protein
MNAIAKYALFGAFSGALFGLWNFGFLQSLPGEETIFLDVLSELSNKGGAGLFYGVVVGAVLRRPLQLSAVSWLLYVVASALSYYAAINVAIYLYDRQSDLMTAVAGAAAGLVGAILLSAATAILAPLARRRPFFAATAIAGAALGLLLPVGLNADSLAMWIAFFALWQAAYAAATAYALRLG